MLPDLCWTFVVDAEGRARVAAPAGGAVGVETVLPGEYLVTLPMAVARELGVVAAVDGDAGFLAATPGDDAGNKPRRIRVLTVLPDQTFGPRDFTVRLSARQAPVRSAG